MVRRHLQVVIGNTVEASTQAPQEAALTFPQDVCNWGLVGEAPTQVLPQVNVPIWDPWAELLCMFTLPGNSSENASHYHCAGHLMPVSYSHLGQVSTQLC